MNGILRHGARLAGLALCCAALASGGALQADTPEELDALVVASQNPDTGLALAQQQEARGELLEALSTVERVLFFDPKNRDAKLAHAVLLCRVDDLNGAAVEIAQLNQKKYDKDAWAAAMATCGAKEAK